ncbi:uncharacterized protein LOC131219590 isoform X2 [Magnolia sinica]|uniref:uncharacterized protein LOC131219590 isoform X2 n=1 Tax=Magnolia sinica TaxID=86752 RepID=UPI002657BF86|nr:uncharacterized protein LOC131219590 isoform X2 [Magnolia sinica]
MSSLKQCGYLFRDLLIKGKPIRMMGVFKDEIEEVSQNSLKPDLRIAGFDEEEKRLRQRLLSGPQKSLKLPQGTYIFCDFRTLHIPGIELNPPASEALKRMHMLASDPGIIAIMNKHRWRVGIMTEMAPVGYVGISPKCILGFNKNHGEEISLRLRTDDLRGFRKYESIKKTLLHELAHMVYSEHDADFYALDKQLNKEAASLDWTKSTGHTLSGIRRTDDYEEEFHVGTVSTAQKLGGQPLNSYANARALSVEAAYQRLLNASANSLDTDRIDKQVHLEPDPDDSETRVDRESQSGHKTAGKNDGSLEYRSLFEPNPDVSRTKENSQFETPMEIDRMPSCGSSSHEESDEPDPDPDDCLDQNKMVEPDPDDSQAVETMKDESQQKLGEYLFPEKGHEELDVADLKEAFLDNGNSMEANHDDSQTKDMRVEPDPDDNMDSLVAREPMAKDTDPSGRQADEPDPDDTKELAPSNAGSAVSNDSPTSYDAELQRIHDPVADVCARLQKAIQMLRSEATPMEATSALQTLSKIIRNVIEHPDEMKFRRLRKANPLFQRNIMNYKAAMEVLHVVGFHEDVVSDELGRAETYMVLKRNDPGMLWLAKSSLEMCNA